MLNPAAAPINRSGPVLQERTSVCRLDQRLLLRVKSAISAFSRART
jgi:hypothetical protein